MDIFHFFHTILAGMFGEEFVLGTGSRHPSFEGKFCHGASDLDLVVLTTRSLHNIKEWVENQMYEESAFSMEKNKIFWKDQHVVDLILVNREKEFPRKFIRCEHGLPWVTPECLLANYEYQYEQDSPGYDPTKRHAEKIECLRKITQKPKEGKNTYITHNLGRNSPLSGIKRKHKSPHSGSKRKLDFGSKSPKFGDNSISKKLFC
jgi:hypothetical protein